jgi:hypothetical protein
VRHGKIVTWKERRVREGREGEREGERGRERGEGRGRREREEL